MQCSWPVLLSIIGNGYKIEMTLSLQGTYVYSSIQQQCLLGHHCILRGITKSKTAGGQVTPSCAEVGGAEEAMANNKGRILDSERSVGLGLSRFSSPQKTHSPEAAFSFP